MATPSTGCLYVENGQAVNLHSGQYKLSYWSVACLIGDFYPRTIWEIDSDRNTSLRSISEQNWCEVGGTIAASTQARSPGTRGANTT